MEENQENDIIQKKIDEKKQEKQATEKVGATAAHLVADYYTGGAYEQIRNAPVVGNVAKAAEKQVGKAVAKSPAGKSIGKISKKLDDAGVIDTVDEIGGTIAGAAGGGGGAGASSTGGAAGASGASAAGIKATGGAKASGAKGTSPQGMGGNPNTPSNINSKDVNAIKNRGSNQADFGTSFSRHETTTSTRRTHSSGLGTASGELEDSELNGEKPETEQNIVGQTLNDMYAKKKESDKEAKGILLKIKVIAAIIIAFIVLLSFLTFIFAIMSAWETFLNGVSTYFGIPETSTEENMAKPDGIFDNPDYYVNPETGLYYTMDELVLMFKEDSTCSKVTFWNKIGDWFDKIDGSFGSICSYIRYIETYITELEEEHKGLMLDRSLIISTIFYGYGTQPNYSQYEETEGSEDIVYGGEHYKSLVDLLKDGKITTDDLKKIIDNTVANTTFTYYTWSIEEETDIFGRPTGRKIGYCRGTEVEDYKYSLLKWKIFMRYGGIPYESYKKTVAELWEQEMSYKKQWDATSEECNGTISLGELGGLVDKLDSSVPKAHKELEHGEIPDIELFEQAATTKGYTKDIFEDYIREKGKNPVHIKFDYLDGFTYNDFPRYKESMEDPNIKLEYDEATTPKEIESNIEYMVEKKTVLNSILLFVDQDDPFRYQGTYNGYSSVITGAYCGDILTAPVDNISVKLTDCDGNAQGVVSMEDYIIGVAYGEISNTEDDYIKAQMVAAISYSLNRRSNYTKGSVISMKNGTCDQVSCSMTKGCSKYKANLQCTSNSKCDSISPGGGGYHGPASSSLIAKYKALYNEVKDLVVIDKNSKKVYSTGYVASVQNQWEAMAKQGMNYTQIIQEYYGPDVEILQCSTYETESHQIQPTTDEVGNGLTIEYNKVVPDKGKFYGYSYKDKAKQEIEINPAWTKENITTINSNCSAANWNKDYQVNTQAVDNYKKAFQNVCNILTNGVTLSNRQTCKYTINDLQGGDTFAQRKSINGSASDISYGIVQDWNYYKEYVINGKTYTPYSSKRSLEEYKEFTDALGSEEHCSNINYILYEHAYKDAGFVWDGKTSDPSKFNPMHFYVKY